MNKEYGNSISTQYTMKPLSRNAIIGYPAGIITGITYGLNPLFAVPLINQGVYIDSILFFRYGLSVLILGGFMVISRQSFSLSWRQFRILLLLGILYTSSSLLLFESYNYIASGLATTIVFLYPVIVALIMVFLKVIPSWKVWISIFATFIGVIAMTHSDSTTAINPTGIVLSLGSATAYSIFIVIINKNKAIASISNSLLTFYALFVGALIFITRILWTGTDITSGIDNYFSWINLIGLALLPTIVSTATLAVATRNIGATKASVLGVFEPITAILIGTLVFNEPLTTGIIVGIIISIAAITFMIQTTKR